MEKFSWLYDDFGSRASNANFKNPSASCTKVQKNSSRRNPWGPQTYCDLITKAIQSSPEGRITLADIYAWMTSNIEYFRGLSDSKSCKGWKNSIRHNLSLHRRFMRTPNEGTEKSSYWMINPDADASKSSRRKSGGRKTATKKSLESKKNPKPAATDSYPSPGQRQEKGMSSVISKQSYLMQRHFFPYEKEAIQVQSCITSTENPIYLSSRSEILFQSHSSSSSYSEPMAPSPSPMNVNSHSPYGLLLPYSNQNGLFYLPPSPPLHPDTECSVQPPATCTTTQLTHNVAINADCDMTMIYGNWTENYDVPDRHRDFYESQSSNSGGNEDPLPNSILNANSGSQCSYDSQMSCSNQNGPFRYPPSPPLYPDAQCNVQPFICNTTQPPMCNTTQPPMYSTIQAPMGNAMQSATCSTIQRSMCSIMQPSMCYTEQPLTCDSAQLPAYISAQSPMCSTGHPPAYDDSDQLSHSMRTDPFCDIAMPCHNNIGSESFHLPSFEENDDGSYANSVLEVWCTDDEDGDTLPHPHDVPEMPPDQDPLECFPQIEDSGSQQPNRVFDSSLPEMSDTDPIADFSSAFQHLIPFSADCRNAHFRHPDAACYQPNDSDCEETRRYFT